MKNNIKFFGIIALIAIIGFSMTACGDDNSGDTYTIGNTNGKLTINNIPSEYNGEWIIGFAGDDSTGADGLFAAADVNSSGVITGGKISNGTVTLKVWKQTGHTSMGNFNGNNSEEFTLIIIGKETITSSDMEKIGDIFGSNAPDWFVDLGFGEVTFSAGIGTANLVLMSDLF